MHWFWRAAIVVAIGTLGGAAVSFAMMGDYGFEMCVFCGSGAAALITAGFLSCTAGFSGWLFFGKAGTARPDETRCRKCGYILRGITEPRCPECGE